MYSPSKYFFVLVTFSLFIASMMETTYGQIVYVPSTGFDEAISPEAYDPLSGDDAHQYVLSDEELEYRIQRLLEVSPFVNGDTVTVHVEYGITILSGHVADRNAMMDAVEIAYDSGATNVKNYLRLRELRDRPWKELTDRELKEAVEDELYWSPFVNSVPIRVQVQDGIVTLSGRVENHGEIVDAVENAYEAGAKKVHNRLWIDPTLG